MTFGISRTLKKLKNATFNTLTIVIFRHQVVLKALLDYEMQINKIVASLTKKASKLGSAAASDPAALRKAAENLYITNRSEDDSFITDFLAASIRPVSGMIGGKVTEGYSGEALANYKLLVTAARDNGFQVSDIIQAVLMNNKFFKVLPLVKLTLTVWLQMLVS